MATPQLDFDPWNDNPAPTAAAGSGARTAAQASALDFDPWSEGQAASDAPAPRFADVRSKVTSTEEKPGFLRTGWEALKRGGASAIASTAHTVADTVDQVAQAPVRQVVGALGQAAKADPAAARAFKDPLRARAVAEENLGVAREIAADRQAVAERIGPRPGLPEWKAHPGDAARSTALRLTNAAGESLPLLAAAVATRSPTVGAALMGGASGAQEYTDLRADGIDRPAAAQAGALTGAVEAAGEAVGLPAILGKPGRGSLGRAALAEGAQEAPVQIAQANIDDQARGQTTPVGEQLLGAVDAALVGGALGGAAHLAGGHRGTVESQAQDASPVGNGDVPPSNTLSPEALALPPPDRTGEYGVMHVGPDGEAVPATQAVQARYPGFPRESVPESASATPNTAPFPGAVPGSLADAVNATSAAAQARDADASGMLPAAPATQEQRLAQAALDARDVRSQQQKERELDAIAGESRLPAALRDADHADALRRAAGVDAIEAAPTAIELAMRRATGEAETARAQAATMRATTQGPLTRAAADALDQRAHAIEQRIAGQPGLVESSIGPATDAPILDFDPHSDLPGAPNSVAGVSTLVTAGNSKIARVREDVRRIRIEPLGSKALLVRGDAPAVRQRLVDAGMAKAARARVQDGSLRFDATDRQALGQALTPALEEPGLQQPGNIEALGGLDFDPFAETAHASPMAAAAAEAATSPKNDHPEPTDAQKEAGNYRKGHTKIGGLDISIENEAGTSRRPEWPPLKHHYGYIKGSVGADKDHVDVFLTEHAEDTSRPVFVVDQYDKGKFDEAKVVMGVQTADEARAAYLANYSPDFQQQKGGQVVRGAGAITQMTQEEFKAWVKDPAKTAFPAGHNPAGLDFDPHQDIPGTAAGMRRDHAERLVRRFTKSLPGAPEIVLVDSAEELHRVAGVQAAADGARAEGLYNGKPAVFLNTAAIHNPKRFRQVLAHEVVGHFGVEQVVGDAWPHIARTVARHIEKGTGARWMREAIAGAQASQPGLTNPQALAREVVAVMAEQGSKNGLLSTVIARTRATLRKTIPSVAWTDRDVRDVLTQAGGFLRGNRRSSAATERNASGYSSAGTVSGTHYSKPGEAQADVTGVAARFDHVTDPQRAALGKIATHRPREPLADRAERMTRNLRARLVQGTVDQFHAFRDLDETAYMQARLSKGIDGAVEGVFRYGPPKLTDGALDIQGDGKGFLGHLQALQGEHDLFLAWVAGHRSEQLAKEGREHLFTPDDIAALKQLNKGHMPDGRSREAVYRNALVQLNRYQSAILDIAQEAGIVNDASRKLWNADFYVPFFRDMAGQPAPAPHPTRGGEDPGDIAAMRKAVIEKLVGGGQPLNDLLENTLQNWGRLLASSMRNMAATRALNVAVDIGAAKPMPAAERGTVSALFHGERRHFMVEDPLVLESLVMLYAPPWSNPAMKSLQWFKRALTIGVTTDPSFRIRNLIRDSLSVVASNGIGANPLRNIAQGWRATERGSDTYLKLLGGGGAIRFGVLLDGDQARHAKRLIEAGLAKEGDILSTPAKAKAGLVRLWDGYQEIGDRAETMNRAALYEQAIAAGKSHLEASYAARDTMDFTNTGAWPAVQFLTRVVPFMNARLQGLYKLGRGAKQYPRRFAAVAGAVATASVLLHLLNQDDEDYRALPDWVRDTYWWIRVPGTSHALYIPKPFELGALGSIAERGTELALAGHDYQLADFAGTLRSILSDQLSMNPIPQAVRPAMEASFNWNSFQGRPIDSMGQERLPAEDRYTARTSAGAVALGRLTGSSPQKIEHLARGYFGWLGLQALNASDFIARDMLALGANPAHDFGKVDNLAVIGSFIKDRDAGSSKYVQRFYDQQREVDMLYAAYAAARQAGDLDRALELAGDDRLKLRGLYLAADREMTKVNRRIRQVTNDKRLSAEAKGELLGGLAQTRDTLAERATMQAREIEARREPAR